MNESKVNISHQQCPGGGSQPVNDPTASITQSCSGFFGMADFMHLILIVAVLSWEEGRKNRHTKMLTSWGDKGPASVNTPKLMRKHDPE